MADKNADQRAQDRMTMDYTPPILAGPTTKKTVKGPKGVKPPKGARRR